MLVKCNNRQFNNILFNTFQQNWKVFIHSVCLSIFLSAYALALVNIPRMSWYLQMLFRFITEYFVLKMEYMKLIVCVERRAKEFLYITVNKEKFLKANVYFVLTALYHVYTALSKKKLIWVIQMYKGIFDIKKNNTINCNFSFV